MTDDLVDRLRQIGEGAYVGAVSDDRKTAREAADRIEQLETSSEGWKEIADEYFDAIGERNTRIEKLEAALRDVMEMAEVHEIPFRDRVMYVSDIARKAQERTGD